MEDGEHFQQDFNTGCWYLPNPWGNCEPATYVNEPVHVKYYDCVDCDHTWYSDGDIYQKAIRKISIMNK